MIHRFACSLAAIFLSTAAWSANVHVSVNPVVINMATGSTTSVDLVVDYDGSDLLVGGGLDLSFDASLLEVLDVTLRAPVDIQGSIGSVKVDGASGVISEMGFASFVGVAGSFKFATIEFRASGAGGTSPLTPAVSASTVYLWVSSDLEPLDFTTSSGAVAVVPEVPTGIALVFGVVLLCAWRRMNER